MSDAASAVPATPTPNPAAAQPVLPHHITFAALVNTFSKTYRWTRDEGLKHSRQQALAMRRDVWIMRCLRERKEAVAQLPWHLEPEDAKDTAQKDAADRLTAVIKATPHLQKLLMQLLEAPWYGVYGTQLVWTENIDVAGEPAMAVTRHLPVNGDKLQLGWDGTWQVYVNATAIVDLEKQGGKIVRGDLAPMLRLDTPAWRERFVIHTHESDDADYFEAEKAGMVGGVGIRDRIYWAVWLRDEMLSWATDYMQKVGTGGLLVFPYDMSNVDAEKRAAKLAEESSQRQALTMPVPPGQDPQSYAPFLLAPNTAGIDALTGMIREYFDRNVELYIVGQTMSSGADKESGLGGSGRAEFAKDTKWNIIKTDARNLEETLTSDFVAVAQKWNTPDVTAKIRWVFDVPDPDAEKKLAAGKTLLDAGLAVKCDELYAAAGYSPPTDDDEIVQLGPGQMGGGEGEDDGQGQGDFGGNNPGSGGAGGGNDSGGDADAGPESAGGNPVKYAAEEEGDGHWVTIGAKGPAGDKHGGTPVFIQGGKIVRGPKGLVDKALKDLGKQAAKEHAEDRAEQKTQAEHGRKMDRAKAAADVPEVEETPGSPWGKYKVGEKYFTSKKAAGEHRKSLMPKEPEPEPAPAEPTDHEKKVASIKAALDGFREDMAAEFKAAGLKDFAKEAKKFGIGSGFSKELPPEAADIIRRAWAKHPELAEAGLGIQGVTDKQAAQPPAAESAPAGAGLSGRAKEDYDDNSSLASRQMERETAPNRKVGALDRVVNDIHPEARKAIVAEALAKHPEIAEQIEKRPAHDKIRVVYDALKAAGVVKPPVEKPSPWPEPTAKSPTRYEADALRDQIAADMPKAPADPEAAERAKENTERLRELDRPET